MSDSIEHFIPIHQQMREGIFKNRNVNVSQHLAFMNIRNITFIK